jgi:hypothetical protein
MVDLSCISIVGILEHGTAKMYGYIVTENQ